MDEKGVPQMRFMQHIVIVVIYERQFNPNNVMSYLSNLL